MDKKYVIDNLNLMKEWHWDKNNELGLKPEKLTCGSEKKAWWCCQKKHEWQANINSRNKGVGCPYCSGQRAFKGFNDLETLNPTLAKEWNYKRNDALTPADVTLKSGKKVWWKCEKGHEWVAIIYNRTKGNGCPYCHNQKVLKGFNDLQTMNPTLAKEWDYEKNIGLTPLDITIGSEKKVWWTCVKGHEWIATIGSRNSGNGCPICYSERNTSFPEYALVYYLKKYQIDVIHSYKEYGYELDVYIPSKKIALEYDGGFWHKNRVKNDLEKNWKCKKDGIKLYRIREELPSLNDSSIDYFVQKNQGNLSEILENILSEIVGIKVEVDLKSDAVAIENLREHTEKENSLLISNPPLAKEWYYEKNEKLKPENFTKYSHKKVWWKCGKGHEWQAKINSRNQGSGCPYCSNNKVLKGYNDLRALNPTLANEWSYEKNSGLTPIDVTSKSGKKVWWKCDKGHEWQATVASRNGRNGRNGCPYCAGQKVLKGKNDLQTVNPTLAKEWNYEMNDGLTPANVMPNSDKKAWWKCEKGHKWQAAVASRNRGKGCPYCSGRYAIKGENDLQTINPILAKEWNYEKNHGLSPTDEKPNSGKKVWWKCNKGHEWQARIADRNKGRGCPQCAREKRKNK